MSTVEASVNPAQGQRKPAAYSQRSSWKALQEFDSDLQPRLGNNVSMKEDMVKMFLIS